MLHLVFSLGMEPEVLCAPGPVLGVGALWGSVLRELLGVGAEQRDGVLVQRLCQKQGYDWLFT